MPPGSILKARLLAASGRPEAQLSLGGHLAGHGSGTEAVRHIAAAARDGLPEAQGRLGVCYLRGLGVPSSQAEARHWLERAADAGDVTALTELATLALGGTWGPYQRGLFPVHATEAVKTPNHRLAACRTRFSSDRQCGS